MDTKLPDTLSGLLRAALDDLEKVEQMPDYTVNMTVWHQPYVSDLKTMKCRVCLAGAMLVTRGADKAVRHIPEDQQDFRTSQKMYAVNCLRLGDAFGAYRAFERGGIRIKPLSFDKRLDLRREIPNYHQQPVEFKAALRTLADDLERAGV